MSYYEQKYLKYKNKYLTLKKQLDEQSGGGYSDGTYVFFSTRDVMNNPKSNFTPEQLGTNLEDFIHKTVLSGGDTKEQGSAFQGVYVKVKPEGLISKNVSNHTALKSINFISNTIGLNNQYKTFYPINVDPITGGRFNQTDIKEYTVKNEDVLPIKKIDPDPYNNATMLDKCWTIIKDNMKIEINSAIFVTKKSGTIEIGQNFFRQSVPGYEPVFNVVGSNLVGGYLYQAGYYVFFCSNSYEIDYILREYENKSFDNFTSSLGTCAMYFRLKSNESKYDIANNFVTVYPNVSTKTSVATNLFKGMQSVGQKVGEGTQYIGQKVGEGINYAIETHNENKNPTKVEPIVSNNQNVEEEKFEDNNPMNNNKHGGALCPGKQFESTTLKETGGLNYDQVNIDKLTEIVNEIKTQNGNILGINSIYIVRNNRNLLKGKLGETSIRQVWNKDNYGVFNEIYKNTTYQQTNN
jgi:hypothetical protein